MCSVSRNEMSQSGDVMKLNDSTRISIRKLLEKLGQSFTLTLPCIIVKLPKLSRTSQPATLPACLPYPTSSFRLPAKDSVVRNQVENQDRAGASKVDDEEGRSSSSSSSSSSLLPHTTFFPSYSPPTYTFSSKPMVVLEPVSRIFKLRIIVYTSDHVILRPQ